MTDNATNRPNSPIVKEFLLCLWFQECAVIILGMI